MRFWLHFFVICHVHNNLPQQCLASKILVYIPLPFYSHQAAYRPVWRELANRGHRITLVTLNPMEEHENITQVDLSIIYTMLEEKNYFDMLTSGEQSLTNVLYFFDLMIHVSDDEFSQPKVRELVNGSEHFDLVITEFYLTVGAAFAHKYNCPLIGMVSMDAPIDRHNTVGNPTHPVLYPAMDLGFSGKLNFNQRGDIIIKKHFGNEMPSLSDMEKNVSMFFINTNPVFHTVRPLNSRTINVGGGLQIEKPKPLPQDIQLLLDQSLEGVIYFSLGSSIRSSQLSNKTKAVIVETFAQLPYKILWKFEKDQNDTFILPKNVHILNWIPQQDVLRHPNIKLFITQGGLQSLEEALFSGVPVLVFPFFGDQILNAQKVIEHGFGLSLDYRTLEVPQFISAILELTTSSRYKQSAIRLARQLSDRPMTGAEKAAWWTEYVLRNRNVDILKHPHSDLPLYQYYFLDILLSVLLVTLAFIYFMKVVFRFFIFIKLYLLKATHKVKSE